MSNLTENKPIPILVEELFLKNKILPEDVIAIINLENPTDLFVMFAKKDNPKHVFDCIAVNSLTAITPGDFIDDISEELKDSNINENDIYLSVQSVKPRPGEWGYKDWCFSTKNLHFNYIFIINNE